MLDRLAARLPARDAGPDPFAFQRISEPICVVASFGQQPLRGRKANQQGRGPCVIADLTCRLEEADRAYCRIRYRVQFGANAALGSADETAPLVA